MEMKCIERFNKMVQVVLLQESDACTITDGFLSIGVIQHGLLECIMSDHDPSVDTSGRN